MQQCIQIGSLSFHISLMPSIAFQVECYSFFSFRENNFINFTAKQSVDVTLCTIFRRSRLHSPIFFWAKWKICGVVCVCVCEHVCVCARVCVLVSEWVTATLEILFYTCLWRTHACFVIPCACVSVCMYWIRTAKINFIRTRIV